MVGDILKDVYQYIFNTLNKDDTVVVAVSGGPDSMALLHLLIKVREKKPITIVCAHVNHNVRVESADEKVFVEEFCASNGVIFEYMKIEEYGEDNFHNEARYKRYSYFEEMIQKYGAQYLFTAHHGDDLMETILMRIVRGSTLHGYSGFSEVLEMDGYKIVRPLIQVSKKDIIAYNEQNCVPSVEDPSNSKDVYTRNRYRKYVLPVLKDEDAYVHEKFYKFSKTLQEYSMYIERQVQSIVDEIYFDYHLNLSLFIKQDRVIQENLLCFILSDIYQDDLMLITDRHVDLIMQLIFSDKPNGFVYLPNQIMVRRSYDSLYFEQGNMEDVSYEMELIESVILPNGKSILIVDECDSDSNFVCRLSSDEVTLPLHVRTRLSGDVMTVKGMDGTKKINDIFIDSKVPIKERNEWPIVVDSKGCVVWLPGIKKSKFNKQIDEKYDIILKYC